MNGTTRRFVRTRLASRPETPSRARGILAASCRDWACPQYLESGSLAVSELVTNAVRHAGTDADIRLDLTFADDGFTVAVHDEGDGEPAIAPDRGLQAGGRGLAIVASLSAGWGVEAEGDGKTVWCRLPAP